MIVGAHNIITSLGWTSDDNFKKVVSGTSGLQIQDKPELSDVAIPISTIDELELKNRVQHDASLSNYTKLEQLCILSLKNIVHTVNPSSNETGFIFSTTKGNIDLLQSGDNKDLYLASTAQKVADYFGFVSKAHVISNACISGVAAFVVAKRWIQSGIYKNVVIVGADVLSKFIVSGFQSFQSLSKEPCKPFDKQRDGLSLGEGVASIVVHSDEKVVKGQHIKIINGAIANDANHISGPSRTGEGLYRAIQQTLKGNQEVDVISAHGTATPFNDDMESHAIARSGFSDIPVSGLKGYFGHTLGAAGVIETIISIMALENNMLIGTKGLSEQGVVNPINVVKQTTQHSIKGLLKLMSGFGGCNAAIYIKKYE